MRSGCALMKYKVTVEVLSVQYQREYDSDAGPTEILNRIGPAIEAKPAVSSQRLARTATRLAKGRMYAASAYGQGG